MRSLQLQKNLMTAKFWVILIVSTSSYTYKQQRMHSDVSRNYSVIYLDNVSIRQMNLTLFKENIA